MIKNDHNLDNDKGVKTLILFVYVRCAMHERGHLWMDLESFSDHTLPWLMVEDFNHISSEGERICSQPRLLIAMIEFNNFIDSCSLVELGSTGGKISWINGQEGSN